MTDTCLPMYAYTHWIAPLVCLIFPLLGVPLAAEHVHAAFTGLPVCID